MPKNARRSLSLISLLFGRFFTEFNGSKLNIIESICMFSLEDNKVSVIHAFKLRSMSPVVAL